MLVCSAVCIDGHILLTIVKLLYVHSSLMHSYLKIWLFWFVVLPTE